jgi:hypothetical protein
MTGKGVCPFYSPVYILGHMLKEGSALAVLKSLEELANTGKCDGHIDISSIVDLVPVSASTAFVQPRLSSREFASALAKMSHGFDTIAEHGDPSAPC